MGGVEERGREEVEGERRGGGDRGRDRGTGIEGEEIMIFTLVKGYKSEQQQKHPSSTPHLHQGGISPEGTDPLPGSVCVCVCVCVCVPNQDLFQGF